MSALPPEAPAQRPLWLSWLRHGALTVAFCLAIGVVLAALAGWKRPDLEIVYSLCIGLSCWALIDGGRLLAAWALGRRHTGCDGLRHGWPGWRWMAACVVVGASGGLVTGRTLGDWLTGYTGPSLWASGFEGVSTALVITTVCTLIATAFFYSRARMAAATMEAEHAQRVAAQAQLMLLQAQLEPHMLFNTLANLRVLIGLDSARAQAMLDHLIAFLRATLEASRVGQHSLAAEFDRLRDYLALMQVRMGPRLSAHLHLPEALSALELPALLLQPLVENAIQHGLEPRIEGGKLHIEALLQGKECVLRVRDEGLGRLSSASETAGTGFGLQQVRDRLSARYGQEARLNLAWPEVGGCEVEIRIAQALMTPRAEPPAKAPKPQP